MTYYKVILNHTLLKPGYFLLESNDEIADNNIISISLKKHLSCIKEKIDNYQKEWDNSKKNVNPYEYIHTIIPGYRHAISKYKPLSRSFFKMIEIANTFNLLENFKDISINTFHLAEGPGGFI